MPERAPLELSAEEIVEPLADLVTRQRARASQLQAQGRSIRVLPDGRAVVLQPNGNDSNSGSE
jgi:hypothetical protein